MNEFLAFLKSLVILIIILDPFLGMVVFLSLTRKMSDRERAEQAFLAVFVAFALLVIFLFGGQALFSLLGISFSSFMVAGGVILLLLGIEDILGLQFSKKEADTKVIAVVIGTPLLCGPGAITSIIVLAQRYGYFVPFLALVSALVVTWILLLFAQSIAALLGERIVEVLSRVLGLLLSAIAVEFIKEGVLAMVAEVVKR
ncbi:MAG: MarC family protein [Candidatus Caldatribacterium sp.]|uniref:MarC family protein n=1 Tax=Candidatus Caldatribacterium sp. TaxID=2282143 RepID=UPI00299389E2|nr:MarC family protein [Candidatus Caldatribacterium sp.]MCX7730525.1 MarC family protein [Candidatus Caldatribacterium sp.]MDW8081837.1 MarC family protein [Candidatus Calescibacterium sp.]